MSGLRFLLATAGGGSMPQVPLPTPAGAGHPRFQGSPGAGAGSCPAGGVSAPGPCPGEGPVCGHELTARARRADATARTSPDPRFLRLPHRVRHSAWGRRWAPAQAGAQEGARGDTGAAVAEGQQRSWCLGHNWTWSVPGSGVPCACPSVALG